MSHTNIFFLQKKITTKTNILENLINYIKETPKGNSFPSLYDSPSSDNIKLESNKYNNYDPFLLTRLSMYKKIQI